MDPHGKDTPGGATCPATSLPLDVFLGGGARRRTSEERFPTAYCRGFAEATSLKGGCRRFSASLGKSQIPLPGMGHEPAVLCLEKLLLEEVLLVKRLR